MHLLILNLLCFINVELDQCKLCEYYTLTADSLRLVKAERTKLTIGLILLLGSAIYTGFYLLCDYGLFWLLDTISRGLRDLHLNIKSRSLVSEFLVLNYFTLHQLY